MEVLFMTLTLIRDGKVDWNSAQLLGGILILAGSSLISLSKVMLKEKIISENFAGNMGSSVTGRGNTHRSLADDYFSR